MRIIIKHISTKTKPYIITIYILLFIIVMYKNKKQTVVFRLQIYTMGNCLNVFYMVPIWYNNEI